jgi:hypothetical protein
MVAAVLRRGPLSSRAIMLLACIIDIYFESHMDLLSGSVEPQAISAETVASVENFVLEFIGRVVREIPIILYNGIGVDFKRLRGLHPPKQRPAWLRRLLWPYIHEEVRSWRLVNTYGKTCDAMDPGS